MLHTATLYAKPKAWSLPVPHLRRYLSRLGSCLHLEALHLDQVVHVGAWGSFREPALHGSELGHLALGRLLLHLELDVVENAVEVHRIQFDIHVGSLCVCCMCFSKRWPACKEDDI